MQRMLEKKLQQQGEDEDLSPTFLARNKDKVCYFSHPYHSVILSLIIYYLQNVDASTDKIFTGPMNLKSRKIAFSAIGGNKLWTKVDGSPRPGIRSRQQSLCL